MCDEYETYDAACDQKTQEEGSSRSDLDFQRAEYRLKRAKLRKKISEIESQVQELDSQWDAYAEQIGVIQQRRIA